MILRGLKLFVPIIDWKCQTLRQTKHRSWQVLVQFTCNLQWCSSFSCYNNSFFRYKAQVWEETKKKASLFRWFSKILHKTEFVRKSLAVTSRSAILKISYFCLVMNFLKKYQIWNYQIFSDNRKAILSRCTIHLQAFVVISGHCRMVPKTLTFYTLFVSQNSYLIVW